MPVKNDPDKYVTVGMAQDMRRAELVARLRSGLDNVDGGELGGLVLRMNEAADLIEALGERDVGIKPLEWRKNYESEFLSFAETVVGRYRVWSHHEADGKWFWRRNDDAGGIVASEQDAKSAAQADFNQRIRSALVPSSERDALRDRVAELEGVARKFMPLERKAVFDAAQKANEAYGQWMPERWIELFIKAYGEVK